MGKIKTTSRCVKCSIDFLKVPGETYIKYKDKLCPECKELRRIKNNKQDEKYKLRERVNLASIMEETIKLTGLSKKEITKFLKTYTHGEIRNRKSLIV